MDLDAAHVERAAIPVKGALRVQLKNRLRQAVVLDTLINAAGGIAERFASPQ